MPRIGAQEKRDLILWIKNILAGLGLNEVITYGLVDKDLIRNFNIAERSPIEILNPLSSEQQILRPALIPSLSRCVAYNLNQKQTHINIFEIAKVFVESDNPAQEKWNLGIALCGTKSLSLEQGVFKEELGFLHLKGILEVLLERLGVKEYKFNPVVEVAGADLCINQEKIGRIMRLSQNILDYLGIKNKEVWLAEVLLDKLLSRADLKKRYHPLPRYPEIIRDISFIIQEEVSLENLLQTLRDKGRPLLRQAMIVDYYKGRQIPSGFRGLTISCY
jgi:phenylalanyl-tRNA synthetase beta chain